VAALSMVGPTARVVGDHEHQHVEVLVAGARRVGAAITSGEYAVSARSTRS
jgi:hypothetical protein